MYFDTLVAYLRIHLSGPEASIDWLRGLFSPSSASRPIISPQMELKDHMIQAMGGDESREINLLEWCKASTLESIGEIGEQDMIFHKTTHLRVIFTFRFWVFIWSYSRHSILLYEGNSKPDVCLIRFHLKNILAHSIGRPAIARIFGWLPYLSWARRLLPTTMGQKIIRWIPNVHIQSAKAAIDAQREHVSPTNMMALEAIDKVVLGEKHS